MLSGALVGSGSGPYPYSDIIAIPGGGGDQPEGARRGDRRHTSTGR